MPHFWLVRLKRFLQLVFGVILAAACTAISEEQFDVVEMAELSDGGYYAWRVHAPEGSVIGASVTATRLDARVATAAVWILDAADLGLAEASSKTGWSGETRVHVQFPPPIGAVATVVVGSSNGSSVSWQETYVTPKSGEWIVVGLAVTDGGARGDYALLGSAGVGVVARSAGPGFLARVSDFDADLEIIAGSAARVIEGAVIEAQSQDRMFAGFFGWTNTGILEMSYDWPFGHVEGSWAYRIDAGPNGLYRFRIDRNIDVAVPCLASLDTLQPVCLLKDVWLFAADVRIP
jgi:hypothetical protein